MSDQPLLLGVRDAAPEHLGIGRDNAYQLIREGRLHPRFGVSRGGGSSTPGSELTRVLVPARASAGDAAPGP